MSSDATWPVNLACDVASLLPGRTVRLGTLDLTDTELRLSYSVVPAIGDADVAAAPRFGWVTVLEVEDDVGTPYSPVTGGFDVGPVTTGHLAVDRPPATATVVVLHLSPPRARGDARPALSLFVDLADPFRSWAAKGPVARWQALRQGRIRTLVEAVARGDRVRREALAEITGLPSAHVHLWVGHLVAAGVLDGGEELTLRA